jgi:hypothetical protein
MNLRLRGSLYLQPTEETAMSHHIQQATAQAHIDDLKRDAHARRLVTDSAPRHKVLIGRVKLALRREPSLRAQEIGCA